MSPQEITLLISGKVAEGQAKRNKAIEAYMAEQKEVQRLSLERIQANARQKLLIAIEKIPEAVFAGESMVEIMSVRLNDPDEVQDEYLKAKDYLGELTRVTDYTIFEQEVDLFEVANTKTLHLVFDQG